MLKVPEEKWREAMANLNARRKVTGMPDPKKPAYYCEILNLCYVGPTLLDVGCGSQQLRACLPEYVEYTGMDPFPIVEYTIEMAIDDERFIAPDAYHTVCAFAVMDGVRDFVTACANIKKLAAMNVIFLTGIGIDPDQYHTLRLELHDFDNQFVGWDFGTRKEISPKVWVLEYRRPS